MVSPTETKAASVALLKASAVLETPVAKTGAGAKEQATPIAKAGSGLRTY
jgi:hypothetical protein